MKAKVLVQILIIAILGTVTVQAQENINREVRKDLKRSKREIRKVKRDLKKNRKDLHVEAIRFKNGDFGKFYFDGDLDNDESIVLLEGKLEHLDKLEHRNIERPDFVFDRHNVDVRTPKVYEYRNLFSEQGSVLELSKDLENVSISKDFFFEVKEGSKSLTMNIDGTLEEGDLTITVKNPDGEVFQKFQISPLADVNWNQQLELDEEGKTYSGKWTINLSGEGATGNYNLRFKAK